MDDFALCVGCAEDDEQLALFEFVQVLAVDARLEIGLQQMQGHTSEKTTQIYLNSFAVDTLNKVNENVADAVSDCIKNAGEKFICLHNTDKT